MDRVLIFDTTLRDGEQSPRHLARRGREARDRRSARAPRGRRHRGRVPDRERRRLRGRRGDRAVGAGPDHRGAVAHGVQGRGPRWEAVRHAERTRIHVFIATSEIHMAKKLRMTPDQVKAEAAAGWRARSRTPTTSSSHPRTGSARTPTSCARSARSRSTPAPRR